MHWSRGAGGAPGRSTLNQEAPASTATVKLYVADAQSARGAMPIPDQRARKVLKTMALDGFLVAPKA